MAPKNIASINSSGVKSPLEITSPAAITAPVNMLQYTNAVWLYIISAMANSAFAANSTTLPIIDA